MIQFGVESHERFIKEIWYDPERKRRVGAGAPGRMMAAALGHGWSALAFAYAAVQVPMLAGLARGRAELAKYLASPIIAVPLTAAVGVGMAMITPTVAGMDVSQHGLIQFALAASISAAVGYAGGRGMARDAPSNETYQRGTIVAEDAAPRRGNPHRPERAHEITLAGRALPPQDEAKHFKLIGTTGTGKSTAIQEIIGCALARGDRAVIADPDGGYLQRFYKPTRGDVVLNPFDPRSEKWDLFAELRSPYDVEQLARSLIPDHEGPDRSWRGYARTFFSAVTRQAHEGGVNDTAELYRLLVVADSQELRTLVRGTPGATVPRRAQQPYVRLHSFRHQFRGRCARFRRTAKGGAVFHSRVDRERPGGCIVHAVQGRTNRGIAVDHFRLDAPDDIRGHGAGREAGR